MAVKGAWVLMVPDSEPTQHRATIRTPRYEGTMVFVPDCDRAVEVCKDLVQKEGVQVITLCPAFTHKEVNRIAESVGEGFPLNVCRTDAPGLMQQSRMVKSEGWYR